MPRNTRLSPMAIAQPSAAAMDRRPSERSMTTAQQPIQATIPAITVLFNACPLGNDGLDS